MNDTTQTTTAIIHATDDSFQQDVIESTKPVFVDFWAPWCGPCKAITPVLEDLAQRDDICIVKVNVDDNSKTAGQYNVRAIPTLLLFKDGELKGTKIGVVTKTELEEML